MGGGGHAAGLSAARGIRPMAASNPRSGRRSTTARAGSGGSGDVSPLVVNRLSVYLRSLRQLEAQGIARISSEQFAQRFHLSPTQVRKDLALFGEFGVRGVGYDVARLARQLSELLNLDRVHRIVIVGMGNLGTSLARFPAFNSGSFRVVAGFDSDPAKIDREVGRVRILPMRALPATVASTGARMAVLTVPAEAAATAHLAVVAAGVRSVLNFAPVSLPPFPGCRVKHVDLRIHLEELAHYAENAATPADLPDV